MKCLPLMRATALVCGLLATGAYAQTPPAAAEHSAATTGAQRVQERDSLRSERETIGKTLQQSEAACYQRFAVEDCLRDARRQAREALARIKRREQVLDAAERHERAAQRLQDIQERESTRPAPVPHQGAAASRPVATERDQAAAQRAQAQQAARAAHQSSQATQATARAAEAERARQNQEVRRQAAQQRKARVQQTQADRAAAGYQMPAPLPPVTEPPP